MNTLKQGDAVPNFSAKDEQGNTISLSDYKGKKLVVFFYPKASTVIETFGVWGPKKFMGREYDGIHRMTFIIDENGIVERVIDKVKTKDHAAQILN